MVYSPIGATSGADRDEIRLAPNGELAGPLPESPELRRQAIENARRMAQTRNAASGGVRYEVTPRVVDAPPAGVVYGRPAAPGASAGADEPPPPGIDQTESGTMAITHIKDLPAFGGHTTPADLNIAADGEYIVTADNHNGLLIYDKCGMGALIVDFDSITTSGVNYGARIHWDEFYKHFAFSFLNVDFGTSTAKIYFGQADDPTGLWIYYSLSSNTHYYDYVDVTTDGDKLFLTYNKFAFAGGAFTGSELVSGDKATFFDGNPIPLYGYSLGTNPANGQPMSAVRLTHMHSWGGLQYLINSEPSGGSFLTLTEVSGTPDALSFNKRTIPTPAYTDPPHAQQSDASYVQTGDARLNDSVYFNGRLWAVGTTTLLHASGDEATTVTYRIITAGPDVLSGISYTGIGGDGRAECFPSVDLDGANRAVIAFSTISETENAAMGAESRADDMSYLGGWITPGFALAHGAGSGTIGDPYRWGNYSGVARAWPEQNLVYVTAMIGNNGLNDWYNYLAVATNEASPPAVVFTPPASLTMTGEQGGPFTPTNVTFNIQNTGDVDGFWKAIGIPTFLDGPTDTQRIEALDSQNVAFTLDPAVNSYPPGVYTETLTLKDCFASVSFFEITLVVGEDTDCNAATVHLAPETAPDGNLLSSGLEYGLYTTAITDYLVCGIGICADLPPGTTVRTRIYEADGNTRGALLLDQNRFSYQTGVTEHYVPVFFQFDECQDYEITVDVTDANVWEYWDEANIAGPIDHQGVIRGRVGSVNGQASDSRPYITLLGAEVPCDNTTDLVPAGETPILSPVTETNRGMYVIPKRTIRLCGIAFFTAFEDPTVVAAKVYNVGFSGRGDLLAEGHIDVGTGGGVIPHWVPIDIVLEEGYIYDISVEYDLTFGIEVIAENSITLPYHVGDVMIVGDGEVDGDATDPYVPHFEIGWEEVGGGVFMGTSPSTGSESTGNTPYIGRGMYIEPLYDHQVYAVSWEADIPENEALTISVYDGTGGTQGALITEQTIFSGGPGMRWHDVPLALDFLAGQEYNVVVTWNAMNGYRQWTGAAFPYTPYDQFDVLGASDPSGAPAGEMIHLRYKTCGGRSGVTDIADRPVRVPMALAPPSPNPTGSLTTLRYQLDEAGPATLAIYDVAGRRVRDIVNGSDASAGVHTLDLDTSGLPSGIYFVRFETPRAVLTRKLVVSR